MCMRIVFFFFFGSIINSFLREFFLKSIFTFNLIFWVLSWLMLLMGFPLFGYTAFISHLMRSLNFYFHRKTFFFCSRGGFFFSVSLVQREYVTLIQIDSWAFNLLFKVFFLHLKWRDWKCNLIKLMKYNRSK